jgi:hypothetical protein
MDGSVASLGPTILIQIVNMWLPSSYCGATQEGTWNCSAHESTTARSLLTRSQPFVAFRPTWLLVRATRHWRVRENRPAALEDSKKYFDLPPTAIIRNNRTDLCEGLDRKAR